MEKNMKTKLKKMMAHFIEDRKAMWIPIFSVATFMLVGYAAIDKEAPVIYSSEIQLAYGEEFDTDSIDIKDNRDRRGLLDVEADTKSLDHEQLGTYTIEVEATDKFNNSTTKKVTVEVVDQVGPEFEIQGDSEGYVIQVPINGSNEFGSYVKAIDNVDGDVTPFMTASKSLDTSKIGFQTISLTATDSSGNENEATYEFAVTDMEAPVINLKQGENAIIDYGCEFNLGMIAEVTDNFDPSLQVNVEGTVDTTKEGVIQPVKITATDASGNKTEAEVKCEVKDISGPVVTLSKGEVTCNIGDAFNPKDYLKSAIDNKDGDVTSKVEVSGDYRTKAAGETVVTFSVTDAAGNVGSASLTLNVQREASSSAAPSYSGGGAAGWAATKVGSAYRYGASGPNAFDCSGFTQWCYAQMGISIPRTAGAQASGGAYVARGDLQPGDLVFYSAGGGGISHVAMYVGNGQIIHAGTPRTGVCYSSVNIMRYVTARRY